MEHFAVVFSKEFISFIAIFLKLLSGTYFLNTMMKNLKKKTYELKY